MNENLTEMVKDDTVQSGPVMFEEADLDLPTEEETEVTAAADETEVAPSVPAIGIMPLSTWFERESDKFDNINEVKVAIRGVDEDKTLIMAVKTGEPKTTEDEDAEDPRNLRVFENADVYPVLDLPAKCMEIYNNGFQIQYDYGDEILIKCYGVRTSLIVTFCQDISGAPIPYAIVRVKKKDEEMEVPAAPDAEVIAGKIGSPLDAEALQLRYKQISKDVGDMNTIQDAMAWLLEKQSTITDINHHLQIDNVIIDTLA
jgi:hypothetical protein